MAKPQKQTLRACLSSYLCAKRPVRNGPENASFEVEAPGAVASHFQQLPDFVSKADLVSSPVQHQPD
jgi:hypothetical protein